MTNTADGAYTTSAVPIANGPTVCGPTTTICGAGTDAAVPIVPGTTLEATIGEMGLDIGRKRS